MSALMLGAAIGISLTFISEGLRWFFTSGRGA